MVEHRTAQAAWQGGKNTGYLPRDSGSICVLNISCMIWKNHFPSMDIVVFIFKMKMMKMIGANSHQALTRCQVIFYVLNNNELI